MIDRRVRVVSKTAWVLAGIAILFVACMEVGWAVPNAAGKPTSQTPALDPTVPVWLIFVDDLHLDFPRRGASRISSSSMWGQAPLQTRVARIPFSLAEMKSASPVFEPKLRN